MIPSLSSIYERSDFSNIKKNFGNGKIYCHSSRHLFYRASVAAAWSGRALDELSQVFLWSSIIFPAVCRGRQVFDEDSIRFIPTKVG